LFSKNLPKTDVTDIIRSKCHLKLCGDPVLQDTVLAERHVASAAVVALVDARRIRQLEVLLLEEPVLVVPRLATVFRAVAHQLGAVVEALAVLRTFVD
jgi:hypothetical protein